MSLYIGILYVVCGSSVYNISGAARDRISVRLTRKVENPYINTNYLKIPVNPPYLKPPEPAINNLGLPIKEYYTTQDLCKVLNISRIRLGIG